MSLPTPNLDDRDFHQLLEEARNRLARTCPEWTDRSPSDPGMVLLELFAHLTEVMIYRLNRLPEKAFIEFLRLIGVRLVPPAAAAATLHFSRTGPDERAIQIPRGTRVTLNNPAEGGAPPVFSTLRTVALDPQSSRIEVRALHCELIEGELAGAGNGLAGQWVRVQRPPLIAPAGDELDLMVCVEAGSQELEEGAPAIRSQGKTFRIWNEVDSFALCADDDRCYVADRFSGTVSFASAVREPGRSGLEDRPRMMARVPQEGREIRIWYRRGGGVEGNVSAHSLEALKDSIPGLQVTNPEPAVGGQEAEELENALRRGPLELHSLQRAVTAQDFELIAKRSSGAVARAKAFTQSDLWTYASPGSVEVLLVPQVPSRTAGDGPVLPALLQEHSSREALDRIRKVLDERRPLGSSCRVEWARYKTVRIKARIVVRREENAAAVRQRVEQRLYRSISPLPGSAGPGWEFGEALRNSHIDRIVLSEPGVSFTDRVVMEVDEVPDREVSDLAADRFQPGTWYSLSAGRVFRSLNGGEGWEKAGSFEGQTPEVVRPHPDRAGMVAMAAKSQAADEWLVHLSDDCGESWRRGARTTFRIRDMAWIIRDGLPILLLATDAGLYELALQAEASPVQILVVPDEPQAGFYAVAASRDIRGDWSVAAAAQRTGGVYLSSEEGKPETFRPIGLEKKDVRILKVQHSGPRSFLWAGLAFAGSTEGEGCYRWELRGKKDPPEGWRQFDQGWKGGSCRSLDFLDETVLAATHRAGLLSLESDRREAQWSAPDVRCGLPLRDPGRFQPVDAVAVGAGRRWVLTGGTEGVYRRRTQEKDYENCSSKEFGDKVTLPNTWLFCSGEHEISVVSEDEAS